MDAAVDLEMPAAVAWDDDGAPGGGWLGRGGHGGGFRRGRGIQEPVRIAREDEAEHHENSGDDE
jgi:hypothetical protein